MSARAWERNPSRALTEDEHDRRRARWRVVSGAPGINRPVSMWVVKPPDGQAGWGRGQVFPVEHWASAMESAQTCARFTVVP